MTPSLEEFQHLHGEAFAHILSNPAFRAGMIHLTVDLMNTIKNLSDGEISSNAVVILSDLRGRLRHESAFFTLALPPEIPGRQDLNEEYVDAKEELFAEHQRNNPPPKP